MRDNRPAFNRVLFGRLYAGDIDQKDDLLQWILQLRKGLYLNPAEIMNAKTNM